MSQVVFANIKTFFTNNDKFSSKFVKILSRERADIVREHVIAVIRADGGEGDIVQDDLGDIAEIRAVRREIRPPFKRH